MTGRVYHQQNGQIKIFSQFKYFVALIIKLTLNALFLRKMFPASNNTQLPSEIRSLGSCVVELYIIINLFLKYVVLWQMAIASPSINKKIKLI